MFGVLTVATPKGGTGKSTLARCLAAHWFALGHKSALIDADPQQTLASAFNPQGPLGAVPVVSEPRSEFCGC